jgi:predicted transposase YdaD
MLDYWTYLRRLYQRPVHQAVLYTGPQPMRLSDRFQEGRTSHGFALINLGDMDAAELLASEDWADNLLALGAKGDVRTALPKVLSKLMAMPGEERRNALTAVTVFSGILKIDRLLESKSQEREFSMIEINLEENAVIRPLIERSREQGREQGRRDVLLSQLADKFRSAPAGHSTTGTGSIASGPRALVAAHPA